MSVGLRAGLGAVGLILLGFALGVGADHLWLAHRLDDNEPPGLSHQESLIAMLDTLNLSAQQREAINRIIHRNHTTVQRHLEEVHVTLRPALDSARREIEALLNPEQLATFHAWIDIEHARLDASQQSVLPH